VARGERGRAGCGTDHRALQLLDERVVDPPADELDDVVARLLVDGRSPTNASGDSVHHQWKSAPPSPQSRRFHSRSRDVRWPFSSVECSSRIGTCQHTFGLPVERPLAGLEGADVQGAAGAAGEAGPVEEDAGVVDERVTVRLRRRRRLAGRRNPPRGLGVELHLARRQPHERLDDVGDVVVVDEVGAVAAAALLPARRRRVEDARAAAP
jgi:hypothetical protein